MIGERPPIRLGLHRPFRRRIRWQRGDEDPKTTRGETTTIKISEVGVVVAEQVGLDRVAVVG
jgi:hypothetical protein